MSTFWPDLLNDAVPEISPQTNRTEIEACAVQKLKRAFPGEEAALIERILGLPGPSLVGLAYEIAPDLCTLVDLTHRLLSNQLDRFNFGSLTIASIPPEQIPQTQNLSAEILKFLDHLNTTLKSLALEFPILAQKPDPKNSPLLALFVETHSTRFGEYFSARCHIYLVHLISLDYRRRNTAEMSQMKSLQTAFSVMKNYLKTYPFPNWPGLTVLDQDKEEAWFFIGEFATYLAQQQKADGSRLAEGSVVRYVQVLAGILASPALARHVINLENLSQASATHLDKATESHKPKNKPPVNLTEEPFFSPEEADADLEDELYSLEEDLKLARQDDLEIAESGFVAVASLEEIENQPEYKELNHRDRAERASYRQKMSTLLQYTTIHDRTTLPLLLIHLGYLAVSRAGQATIDELGYFELGPLTLYHLALITGRKMDDLIQMTIKQPSSDPALPVYYPDQEIIVSRPRAAPGLIKLLRDVPDQQSEPEAYASWKEKVDKHHAVYRQIEVDRQWVLDDVSRYLLHRLYALRQNLPQTQLARLDLSSAGKAAITNRLFLAYIMEEGETLKIVNASFNPSQCRLVALDHEIALELITRPINRFVQELLPGYPRVSFAQIRRTFWSRSISLGAQPTLAQFQSDVYRMELRARLYYANSSLADFKANIRPAQHKLIEQVEGVSKNCQVLFEQAGLRLPKPLLLKRRPDPASPTQDAAQFYGSCYHPRPELVTAVIEELFLELARLADRLGEANPYALEWHIHNARVYLCAFLTSIATGARMIEISNLKEISVDIRYSRVIITLEGKGNRFNEEDRNLIIPPGLVPLWLMVLGAGIKHLVAAGASDRPTLLEQPRYALNLYDFKLGTIRPLSRADIWREFRRVLDLARPELAGKTFKFHSLRDLLASYLLKNNMPDLEAAYALGHQTSGKEAAHPHSGYNPGQAEQNLEALTTALLTSLGANPAALAAVTTPAALPDERSMRQLLDYPTAGKLLASSMPHKSAEPFELPAPLRLPLKPAFPIPLARLSASAKTTRRRSKFRYELLQTAAAGKEQSEAAPGRELPEPLEKALETLLDQEHAGTPLLKRSINFVKAALLDPKLKIQLRRDNKLEGLPPNWLQLTFRRFCQPDGHRFRIKKRRRSNYVKLFNLIGEALNPYLTADLERVINSGRGARGLAIPSRAILITQAATWLALNRKLEEEVLLNPATDHRKLCMRWVILMVARLGLTFENSLAALAQIQIKHITLDWVTVYFEMARPKDQSQAKVAGERYLRVWLDQLTAIALDTLLVHLARNKLAGVKRRQVQPLHPDIYILTQTLHKPDQESVASLRNELNCYLNGLCQEVGVGITTLEQLSRTARWSLWEQGIYPADVIDGLAGYSPTSPLPDRRVANKSWKTISAEWQTPDALPAWVGRVADNNLSSFSRASSFNTNTGDDLIKQPGNEIEDTQKDEDDTGRRLSDQPLYKARLERIHEITQPLHHLDKLDSARQLATKKRVIKGLQNLGCKWLGVKDPEQLGEALAAAAVASSAIDQATFNLVALVAWLAWLVQKTSITRTKAMDKAKLAQPQNEVSDQPPLQADATPTKKTKKLDLKTIFAYRSDAEAILGLYPTARITELGEDEQDEILEADRVANPRVRRRSAWKSWHDCLRQEYKLPLAPLKLHSVWQPHRTDPEELLTPTDMHELMKLLAQVAGSDLHLARMAFNATPLCYYLMLRISEIIKLKLKDIILYGDRAEYHVLVRKSKRGKSRRIFLQDVPNEVINFLKKLVQARRAELKAQGAGGLALAEAYLICDTHGQLLNESRFSALFTQALRHPTLDRPGATHHYLRKSGASWRYLMGVDPREISLALGHSTVEITYLSYLRVVDLHQLKAVSRLDCSIEISATEVAPLLDIARPQAERRIIQEGNFSLKEYQVNSRVWQRRVLNTKNVRGMLRADLAKLWFGLTPKCIAHES